MKRRKTDGTQRRWERPGGVAGGGGGVRGAGKGLGGDQYLQEMRMMRTAWVRRR